MTTIVFKVFSAFAGIDTQFMALERFEMLLNEIFKGLFQVKIILVGWCEIDPYAIQCHNALFPQYRNCHYADITKVLWGQVPHFDVLFYSSCCQDITRNGNQAGLVKGSGTRSSLIWHMLDALKERKPAVAILENVPALLEKTFCNEFCKWQEAVDDVGYRSCWGTLRASDFGIAQNRNRAFMVSVRNDIAHNIYFPAPLSHDHMYEVESVLDDIVDNKYYYAEEDAVRFILSVVSLNVHLNWITIDENIMLSIPIGFLHVKQRLQCLTSAVVAEFIEVNCDMKIDVRILRPIETSYTAYKKNVLDWYHHILI